MKTDFQTPKFFDQLSYEDQKSYLDLHSYLSSKECRNNRGQRLNKFSEILTTIHNFCIKNDENDVKRCMVCGVFWLPPKGIAINIRQLHILLDKCKSSINGSLQRMGYNPLPPKNEYFNQLCEYIPSIKNNFAESREWTIRTLSVLTPQPEPYPVNSLMHQETYQASQIQNNFVNSKVNNSIYKNMAPSMPMNSFTGVQNAGNTNYYSSFSSPQPNIYMNQFMTVPPNNSNQEVQKKVSFQPSPQTEDNSSIANISNSFGENSLDTNDFGNYFDDPFCLPPSSLFDEGPFDSWPLDD